VTPQPDGPVTITEKTTVDRGAGADRRGVGRLLADLLLRRREASILLVAVAVAVYFSLTTTSFNTASNYHTIAQYIAPWAIIAAGEVMLLICGEIDLSAGFVFTLAPFAMIIFYNNGVPLPLALIGALVVCAAIGAINGLIVTRLRMSSFITTLGMGFLVDGIMLIVSDASPVSAPQQGFVPHLLGGWYWSELLWAIGIVLVMQVVLAATRFGVYTLAVGGNPVGAAEAGVRTGRIKTVNFMVTGLLAGCAGILDGTRVGSFDPTSGGNDYMFYAVAAAVIGGTALLGGSGTVVGAFIGALVLGIVHDGFNLAGVNANAFNVVLGLAVLIAMLLNISLGRFRRGSA
jgi:simple sugar transport system permease protein